MNSSEASSDSEGSAGRPRKRPRVESRPSTSLCRRLLLEQVDLEIALQVRLATTVKSRIEWALLLQDALRNGVNSSGINTFGFEDAALDALSAVEAPCDVLFTREIQPVAVPHTPILPSPGTHLDSQAQPAYATRTRGLHRTSRPTVRKLLYLRNTAKFPPQIVKLACPDCSRTDFSSLQGLLNHCRLGHQREFGSHDDCVQSCAVLVEDAEDAAWLVANGTEVGGVSLPGLRRLFELAVGGGQGLLSTPVRSVIRDDTSVTPAISAIPKALEVEVPADSVHAITKTLGYHIDSPSLAPFLGRTPKRRHINVHDEDQVVDIFAGGDGQSKPTWRKSYAHRNKSRATLDDPAKAPQVNESKSVESLVPAINLSSLLTSLDARGSRFHILARVSVKDISLWIPPERRLDTQPEHTHLWRLAVTSPSYSLPLSSFLTKLTITSLTEPPPPTLITPVVVDKPPFVLTGVSDQQFLARLECTWVGHEGQNPSTTVDHWVELDPFEYANATLGDEQFFDVELDRQTEFLPATETPDAQADLFHFDLPGNDSKDAEESQAADSLASEPKYSRILRALLPQAPLTLRDVKGKSPQQLPYTLVASAAQYRNLQVGRRKALEWSRARVLRAAYDTLCASSETIEEDGHVPLTTLDVLHWLEDRGLYPRSANSKPPASATPTIRKRKQVAAKIEEDVPESEVYCRRCGLHFSSHPSAATLAEQGQALAVQGEVKIEPASHSIAESLAVCTTFNTDSTSLGPLDVSKLLKHATSFAVRGDLIAAERANAVYSQSITDTMNLSPHDLVTVADPSLIVPVQQLCTQWYPRAFSTSAPGFTDHTTSASAQGSTKDQLARDLAPAALLSLATRSLVKALMQGGLEEYHRDQSGLRALGSKHHPRRGAQGSRLLTPSHILRGLTYDASRSALGNALMTTFAPLGIALPVVHDNADDHPADEGEVGP